MNVRILIASLFLCFSAAPRSADDSAWKLPPETARFKPGKGVELATAQCLVCHSADYVSTQPPLSRAAWGGIVAKMKDKYGAPIAPASVEPLVNYLAATYGQAK